MSFISYLVNGLSLGSVYALIALGYTMVYGIAKMLNFAHGDVIMIGAYVALITMKQAGLPTWVAILISIIACTVLGVLMERVAYKPLRNATSSLAVLITAIGVSSASECSTSDLRCECTDIPISDQVERTFTCRWQAEYFRRDNCYDRSLCGYYDRINHICSEDKARTGDACSIRG